MVLRYKDIGEIIRLIDASSCDEFVLETDEVKLVLRRHGANPAGASSVPPSAAPGAAAPGAGSANPAEVAAAPGNRSATSTPVGLEKPGVVTSPMVGTLYRAPEPDAPPFVEVGSKVEAGDPLCLIEVMKLFTTVYAEFAGMVTEIGAQNGQLVEYGQMLFVIEPNGTEDV